MKKEKKKNHRQEKQKRSPREHGGLEKDTLLPLQLTNANYYMIIYGSLVGNSKPSHLAGLLPLSEGTQE